MNQAKTFAIRIDQDLLERLCADDQRAWREVYSGNRPKVIGYLLRRSVPNDVANEIFQETLLFLDQRKATLTLTCKLSVYLIGVAINKLKEYWKKKGRSLEQLTDDFDTLDRSALGDDTADMAELELLQLAFADDTLLGDYKPEALIQDGLKLLSEKCVALFTLRYWEGINDQQIAEKLSVEYDMVRKQIYKCKEKMKVILQGLREKH